MKRPKLSYPNFLFRLAYSKLVRWYFKKFSGLYASAILGTAGRIEIIYYTKTPYPPFAFGPTSDMGPQQRQLSSEEVKKVCNESASYLEMQHKPNFDAELAANIERLEGTSFH